MGPKSLLVGRRVQPGLSGSARRCNDGGSSVVSRLGGHNSRGTLEAVSERGLALHMLVTLSGTPSLAP